MIDPTIARRACRESITNDPAPCLFQILSSYTAQSKLSPHTITESLKKD